jgi:hypothetical protein
MSDYSALAPSDGVTLTALNNGDVVLNISSSSFTKYDEFKNATHQSIHMFSANDDAPAAILNDEDCLGTDKNGAIFIKPHVLSGLEIPLIHNIHFTISYLKDDGVSIEVMRRFKLVPVLGEMDQPVIESISSKSNGTEAILKIAPHEDSEHSKARRDDIMKVEIVVYDILAKTKVTTNVDHQESGEYTVTGITLGKSYRFSCFMRNSSGNFSRTSDFVEYTSTNKIDIDDEDVTAEIIDGGDLRVTVDAQSFNDITGSVAEIDAYRPLQLIVRTAIVPADMIEQSDYVPTKDSEWSVSTFNFSKPKTGSTASTLAAQSVLVPAVNGFTVVYQAAIVNGNGTGLFSTLDNESIEVNEPGAPELTVGDKFAVKSEIKQVTTGLQLIGYEFVATDKDDVALTGGAWSFETSEKLISGATASSTIGLSSFSGIKGNGDGLYPTVSTRAAAAKFTPASTIAAPFVIIKSRGVYVEVDDLETTNFLKKSYARGDFSCSGTINSSLKLTINAMDWVLPGAVRVYGDWAYSEQKISSVSLTAFTAPTATYSVVGSKTYATVKLTHANRIASGSALLSHSAFAEEHKAELMYILINKVTKEEFILGANVYNKELIRMVELTSGEKQDWVLVARVLKGAVKLGESAEASVSVPLVPGASRPLSGRYTCDSAIIATTTDYVLAHSAADLSGALKARFAIDYISKLSEAQNVTFAQDHLYEPAFYMSDLQVSSKANPLAQPLETEWGAAGGAKYSATKTGDNSTPVKYFNVMTVITLADHKRYRVNLYRRFVLKSTKNAAQPSYINDISPTRFEFITTIGTDQATFTAQGSEGRVDVQFESPAATASSKLINKYLGGFRNEVLIGEEVVKSSSEDVFSFLVSSKLQEMSVTGRRSHANPNSIFSNGLKLVDAERVCSDESGGVLVNVMAGPAKLTGVSVETVLNTNGTYSIKFMCDKPASGVTAKVSVTYDDDAEENNDQRTEYTIDGAVSDDATKFQKTVLHSTLITDFNSRVSAKDFIEDGVICNFVADDDNSDKHSEPVAVSYKPNMESTLAVADFKVEKFAGGLKVSTDKLSVQQLGGNANLSVKIVATDSSSKKFGDAKLITLGSAGLSETILLSSGVHTVSVIIQKSDLHVLKPIALGSFAAGAALLAAKADTFKVTNALQSVTASWTKISSLPTGWTIGEQALYVTGLDADGNQIWYIDANSNDFAPANPGTAPTVVLPAPTAPQIVNAPAQIVQPAGPEPTVVPSAGSGPQIVQPAGLEPAFVDEAGDAPTVVDEAGPEPDEVDEAELHEAWALATAARADYLIAKADYDAAVAARAVYDVAKDQWDIDVDARNVYLAAKAQFDIDVAARAVYLTAKAQWDIDVAARNTYLSAVSAHNTYLVAKATWDGHVAARAAYLIVKAEWDAASALYADYTSDNEAAFASKTGTSPLDSKRPFTVTSGTSKELRGFTVGESLSISLETTYIKTGETNQVARVETQAVCGGAPLFKDFTYESSDGVVYALINQQGAYLKDFLLFATYADGVVGEGLIRIPLTNWTSKTRKAEDCMVTIVLPAGPKPTGIMGFMLSSNGSMMAADPDGTFGQDSVEADSPYQRGSADEVKIIL